MSVTFWCPDAPQQESEALEINMSNSHAHNMLDALGLADDDYPCGSLEVATAEPIIMKAQATATLNRMNGSHYWADRLEQFIGLVGYARKNNYKEITWG